jgi:putative flippase GtrA
VGGFSVAVTTNYLINRFWSFKNARFTPLMRSYVVYVGANLAGLGVRLGVVQLLMRLAGIDRGYGYLATNFAGIVAATAVNFVGAKYLAFSANRAAFKGDRLEKKGHY